MHTRHLVPRAPTIGLALALLTTSAFAADPKPTAQARAHFMAGVEYLKNKSYDEAYREFKESYAATPSWKILGNLGIAADRLERCGEAIDALQEYLEKGGKQLHKREAAQVRDDLDRLRGDMATVTLEWPGRLSIVDARLTSDGSVANQYGPFEGGTELRVRAGRHEFQLEQLEAKVPIAWSVTLSPGDTIAHTFVVEPESRPATPPVQIVVAPTIAPETDSAPLSHTTSYMLWGTGALAAVGGSVFFIQANKVQKEADADFKRLCPVGASVRLAGCDKTTGGDKNAAHWRTAALVTGIGAATALVAGTLLYWLAPSAGPAAPASVATHSVQPWFSSTAVGVTGYF